VVRATTSGGVSTESNEANATTQSLAAAPGNLAATAVSTTRINLTWDAVPGATRYTVYRSTTPGGPYTQVAVVGGTSYANTRLSPGTTYYYVVRATTPAGVSPNSNEASAASL